MHTYIHKYIHAYIHTSMHACMHTYILILLSICMHIDHNFSNILIIVMAEYEALLQIDGVSFKIKNRQV